MMRLRVLLAAALTFSPLAVSHGWAAEPATTQAATQPTLKVGDLAPPLNVARWLKGEPVEAFEPGTVYVVEFWATWCGPCIAAMPDLSWLQAKYPEMVFIGVNGLEKDPTLVEPFVRRMGDQIQYRLAADVSPGEYASGPLWTAWMDAAGIDGIPCSFIIGADGRIARITHPARLPPILKAMHEGTFDAVAEAAANAKAEPAWKAFAAAREAKDYDAALRHLDEIELITPGRVSVNVRRAILILKGDFAVAEAACDAFERNIAADEVPPSDVDQLARDRLWLYFEKKDAAAVNRQAAAMAQMYAGSAQRLNRLAWQLVGAPAKEYQDLVIDLDLVLRIATQASAAADDADSDILDTLARVRAVRGEFEQAAAVQTRAFELEKDPDRRARFEQTLAAYRAGRVQ